MKISCAISLLFAVQTVSAGQFITGPCKQDSDCNPFAGQQGCCERTQKICRAVLSLTPGVQACGDGRTPNFSGGQKVVNIDSGKQTVGKSNAKGKAKGKANGKAKGKANGKAKGKANGKANGKAKGNANGKAKGNANGKANQKAASSSTSKAAGASSGSGKPKGAQFITGPCAADNDCASTCCERTQKICRAILSLTPGVQACGDGRTPNFDAGAKIVNINDKQGKSATPPTKNNSQGKAQSTGSGKPKGTQFITGACGADDDCASNCCEKNQKKCRAFGSLTPKILKPIDWLVYVFMYYIMYKRKGGTNKLDKYILGVVVVLDLAVTSITVSIMFIWFEIIPGCSKAKGKLGKVKLVYTWFVIPLIATLACAIADILMDNKYTNLFWNFSSVVYPILGTFGSVSENIHLLLDPVNSLEIIKVKVGDVQDKLLNAVEGKSPIRENLIDLQDNDKCHDQM
ncbi:hypothetical protein HDV06_000793 [Boothiomyces sp. JEL0866]|nr:hypothetical protein HDV06_000793 [Boothiomyces sp. JEL0866]